MVDRRVIRPSVAASVYRPLLRLAHERSFPGSLKLLAYAECGCVDKELTMFYLFRSCKFPQPRGLSNEEDFGSGRRLVPTMNFGGP